MPDANHPTVASVLQSIADWVNAKRSSLGRDSDLGQCDPSEVAQIARDLGITSGQLRELSGKSPHAADQLQQMLVALKIDPDTIAKSEPLVMRDLQRVCSNCACKTQCAHELDVGTAAAHVDDFCPNASTLDALVAGNKHAAK